MNDKLLVKEHFAGLGLTVISIVELGFFIFEVKFVDEAEDEPVTHRCVVEVNEDAHVKIRVGDLDD